ncbi:MAG: NAD(P)-dependent oxidoreductase [Bacteroidetes bacterium]|nr:NAD(P)-dependent oxidoreductase [Bacteroidota bacterium]
MILVTGATSFVGQYLVNKLVDEGHSIRIITRNRSYKLPVSVNIEIKICDIRFNLNDALEEIDTVIHLAAATSASSATTPLEYYQTNVEGTSLLINECIKRGIKRFIYISSSVVDYPDLKDDYSNSKRQAELLVQSSTLNWTILRPSEILGAKKEWEALKKLLKQKIILWIFGKGDYYRHPVYYKDIVFAILAVLYNKKTEKKIYNISCANPVTYFEYVRTLREVIKANYIVLKIPELLLKPFIKLRYCFPYKVQQKLNHLSSIKEDHINDISTSKNDFLYNPLSFKEMVLDIENKS